VDTLPVMPHSVDPQPVAGLAVVPLTSSCWAELADDPRRPRLVPELLARLRQYPDDQVWAELLEQCVHQRGLRRIAYAAVPHLVQLAVAQDRWWHPDVLLAFGWAAQPCPGDLVEPVPADLAEGYRHALAGAAVLALRAVRERQYPDDARFCTVLAAAAYLHHRPAAGALLESIAVSSPEPICPSCTSQLIVVIDNTDMYLEHHDRHGRPVGARTHLQPARTDAPDPDRHWLRTQCEIAGRHTVRAWIDALHSPGVCPVCAATFVPAATVDT
jgi:hypothetical protein